MTKPHVTVVMPVFNAAATLDATIASILAQSAADFELIAIDDGSTDDSLSRLLAHAAADDRIHVITHGNSGVSAARNLGADLGKAPLIAFIDADDIWDRDKLARHIAFHKSDPAAAGSYARIAFLPEEARSLTEAKTVSRLCRRTPQLQDVLGENPICTASNLVLRRDWFLFGGGFDAHLSYAEDQELVAHLIARGARIEGIDAILTGYRFSRNGLSMNLRRMYAGWRKVARRHLAADELPEMEALYCRYLARRALRGGGRPAEALLYVFAGLRLDALSFMREGRRGLSTLIAALAAPLIPAPLRLRLFA
ncbi:MAG: glycosyltransferase family A protein [Sphingopyxis sp.]|uniref:glycosyltransferase family 2 protein n=1 Tax=Sphingopyxis sp. TaxID=1908224 RepID=UPI002ABAB29C|nr:glycosyltransferase family A protein [Sphingopyxis sp.]MDZ3830810.1 glycosyltransferase family A protein [Sphingopyxis sp.]